MKPRWRSGWSPCRQSSLTSSAAPPRSSCRRCCPSLPPPHQPPAALCATAVTSLATRTSRCSLTASLRWWSEWGGERGFPLWTCRRRGYRPLGAAGRTQGPWLPTAHTLLMAALPSAVPTPMPSHPRSQHFPSCQTPAPLEMPLSSPRRSRSSARLRGMASAPTAALQTRTGPPSATGSPYALSAVASTGGWGCTSARSAA
mmetsp:Transcript_18510/g.51850  ORF Transcript_18510/g.51850 Transcript_18510/m.51850 type:complete len:201 (-) Transcript_18510:1074-1676(-)